MFPQATNGYELNRDMKISVKGKFGLIGMTEALLRAGFEVGGSEQRSPRQYVTVPREIRAQTNFCFLSSVHTVVL